jgi:hypothetical protein
VTNLEKEFTKSMRDLYLQTKRECGYNATRFLQLISSPEGAVPGIKRLIMNNKVSQGWTELCMQGRLDLSVEFAVLDPRWQELFSEDERENCQKWLLESKCISPADIELQKNGKYR